MPVGVKTVSAEVAINSAIVRVSQINLLHTIDDLPQASIVMQIDNNRSRSTEINTGVFTKFCANMQNYMFNKFKYNVDANTSVRTGLLPDLRISATDGDGNTINFNGFVSRPQFSVLGGVLQLGISGVHSAAALQNFGIGTYPLADFYLRSQLPSPDMPNSIASRVGIVVDKVLEQFEKKVDPAFEDYAELTPTHTVNKAVNDLYLKNFLALSKVMTLVPLTQRLTRNKQEESLLAAPAARANKEIFGILMNSQNFLAAIPAICDSFKFQFNSTWDGRAWMEVIRMHEDPDGRSIRVPMEDVRFNVAAAIEAPISRVYVRAGRMAPYATVENPGLRQLATYPLVDPNNPNDAPPVGIAYVVDAPPWLADVATPAEDLMEDSMGGELSLAKGLQGAVNMDRSFKLQLSNRQNLLDWLAEYTYKEHFLKYATATVTIPLCLPIQVGKTYQVIDVQGNHLFTGYLTTVSHAIAVDAQASASKTGLSFSHVKANGFVKQFPGIVGNVLSDKDDRRQFLA